MSEIDETRARELLQRERTRVEAALRGLQAGRSSELEEIETATDPADDAGLIEEEEIDDALISQLRGELEAIERAERRLEEGTYGLSVESGEPIPAGRLEAGPRGERPARAEGGLVSGGPPPPPG